MAEPDTENGTAATIFDQLSIIHEALLCSYVLNDNVRENDENEAVLQKAVLPLVEFPASDENVQNFCRWGRDARNASAWEGGYGLLVDVANKYPFNTKIIISILHTLSTFGTDTPEFRGSGAISLFIRKLSDEEEGTDIISKVAWGLANIARCAIGLRDLTLQEGGVQACNSALKHPLLQAGNRKNITWALLNMCRGDPSPEPEFISELIECYSTLLTRLIAEREAACDLIGGGDETIVDNIKIETIDVLWGISYITDGNAAQRDYGVKILPQVVNVLFLPSTEEEPGYGDAPVVERLVPCEQMAHAMEYLPRADLERLCMLNSDIWNCCVCANRRLYNRVRSTVCHKREVRIPAIRIIGNVMTGDDDQTQAAIDSGALRVIESVAASLRPIDASNYDKHVAAEWKELCWILSNLTAGTEDQVRLVVQSGVFYNFVMEAVRVTVAHAVAKEAVMVVANVLAIVPKETPLGWIAATFAYLSIDRVTEESLLEEYCSVLLSKLVEVQHPQLPTSLSTISTYVTDDSTPENLLLLADTYTRDDCAGSATDKFTPLMRDHVLPVLYASGRLDDNPAFTTTGDVDGNGANDEEAWQDVESTDDEV